MGTIKEGVKQAIENCLKVRSNDNVVIITDKETLKIGSALKQAIEKITTKIQFFIMEDFGIRPIDFPAAIRNAIRVADVSIYAAQGAEGELQTFRMAMIKSIDANPNLRHAHMIGITPEIMKDGMCSDYKEIQRISRLVYEKVKNAKRIKVVTEKGADFIGEFSSDIKWVVSDGDIQPGFWKNLPDGEVFTCPANVEGTIVIDGCLGDFFTEKYGSVEKTPVTIVVSKSRAIRESIKCKNKKLLKEFIKYLFENDKNSDRIGEFAIGTNTGLKKLIYNLLQDEKFPGIHVAFGSSHSAKTGAKWESKSHVDGVLKNPFIYVDDEMIMNKGNFVIE